MTLFLFFLAWAVVAGPFAIVLGASLAANARTDEDATYDRLCSASFGGRIPTNVDLDRRDGVRPRTTNARPGLPIGEPGPASNDH